MAVGLSKDVGPELGRNLKVAGSERFGWEGDSQTRNVVWGEEGSLECVEGWTVEGVEIEMGILDWIEAKLEEEWEWSFFLEEITSKKRCKGLPAGTWMFSRSWGRRKGKKWRRPPWKPLKMRWKGANARDRRFMSWWRWLTPEVPGTGALAMFPTADMAW